MYLADSIESQNMQKNSGRFIMESRSNLIIYCRFYMAG